MKIVSILLAFLLISLNIFSISPFHVNAFSPQPPIVRQMCYAQQTYGQGNIISCTISSGIQTGDLLFVVLIGSTSCTSTVSDTLATHYKYVYNCLSNFPTTTSWTGVVPSNGGTTITATTTQSQITNNGLGLFVFDIGNLINYFSYGSESLQSPITTGVTSANFAMASPVNVPAYSLAIGLTSVQLTSITSCSGITVSTTLTYAGVGSGCYRLSDTGNIIVYADSYTDTSGTVQLLSSVSDSSGTFTTTNGYNLVFIVENIISPQNYPPTCTQCPNSGGGSGSGNAGLGINYLIPIALTNLINTATANNLPYPVHFNSSAYSSYLGSNDQNIVFMDNNGNPLYAWCETNCTNTATSTLFYVNLGTDIIPTYNTMIIWIGIYSTNFDDRSSSGYYGQNPTIAGVTKDNGAKVFIFYDDFAGTTLNNAIWTYDSGGTPNLGTYSVNNGLTLTSSSSTSGIEIHTISRFAYQDNNHVNYTFEWYIGPFPNNQPASGDIKFGWNNETLDLYSVNQITVIWWKSATQTGGSTPAQTISVSTSNNLFGVYANGQFVVGTFDYTQIGLATTSYIPPTPWFGGLFNSETSITTPPLYFVRDRMMWTLTQTFIGTTMPVTPLFLPPVCNQPSVTILGIAIFLAIFFFIWLMYRKAKHEGITKDTIMWIFYFAIIVIILLTVGMIGLTASSQICPASG